MMKKDDANRKNKRKNKSKTNTKVKPKINNKDMYDLTNYFAEEIVANISDENKQTFADGIQRILDRAEEKNN